MILMFLISFLFYDNNTHYNKTLYMYLVLIKNNIGINC